MSDSAKKRYSPSQIVAFAVICVGVAIVLTLVIRDVLFPIIDRWQRNVAFKVDENSKKCLEAYRHALSGYRFAAIERIGSGVD